MYASSSMRFRLRCLPLALGVSLTIPSFAADSNATRQAMADAMARMMEAMGMFSSSSPSSGTPFGGYGAGDPLQLPYSSMYQFPYMGGFRMPGQSGWPSPFPRRGGPQGMLDMMRQYQARSGGAAMPWAPPAATLDGLWEGRNGELMLIRGSRFRIYDSEVRYVDGVIRLDGGALTLYNPEQQHTQSFEYAQHEGRLVMQDSAGQLYLYRRVSLAPGQQAPWREPTPRSGRTPFSPR